jgi:hypothetical protein
MGGREFRAIVHYSFILFNYFMPNYLIEILENLLARTKSPLLLRFILGPLQAIVISVLFAKRDVQKQYPPYLWRFLATSRQRRDMSRQGLKDICKLFVLAVSIDIIYQLSIIILFNESLPFNALEAAFVAVFLTVIPYIFIRGPVHRIIARYYAKRKKGIHDISQRQPPHIH